VKEPINANVAKNLLRGLLGLAIQNLDFVRENARLKRICKKDSAEFMNVNGARKNSRAGFARIDIRDFVPMLVPLNRVIATLEHSFGIKLIPPIPLKFRAKNAENCSFLIQTN